MNIVAFPVNTTNIFPIANSTAGGQLVTEFNLRSRETVDTDEEVQYQIGHSFTHGEDDFYVRIEEDGTGVKISDTALEILPGRALVNGHFLECFSTILIDMDDVAAQQKKLGLSKMSGKLCVGLRAMYSTLPTMAGAMVKENSDNMYEGVQVVILPENEFKLPEDVPDDEDKVTAHLLLATFTYQNDKIVNGSVENNYPAKCYSIDATRIAGVEDYFSDLFISKYGLDPEKLYVYSGKGKDPSTGKDTWCQALDSLMVWDNNPTVTAEKPAYKEAEFTANENTEKVELHLPHKQVDGMTYTDGTDKYYADKTYTLPLADWESATAGTVGKTYKKDVQGAIETAIKLLYKYNEGKMRAYIETLTEREEYTWGVNDEQPQDGYLPRINQADWEPGDYVVVQTDDTVDPLNDDLVTNPSTMYIVLPGQILEVYPYSTEQPSGTELAYIQTMIAPDEAEAEAYEEMLDNGKAILYNGRIYEKLPYLADEEGHGAPSDWDTNWDSYYMKSTVINGQYTKVIKNTHKDWEYFDPSQYSSEDVTPSIMMYVGNTDMGVISYTNKDGISTWHGVGNTGDILNYYLADIGTTMTQYRGVENEDYFTVVYNHEEDTGEQDADGNEIYKAVSTPYYFMVETTNEMIYSDPVYITGQIPFAQEELIGGFLNVPDTATDEGYVYRDDNGNLRLVDYSLLRSGTLAYQLGEDYTIPSGLTNEEVQAYLDEYVNQRVAFPNANQIAAAAASGTSYKRNPNVIDVYINLAAIDSSNEETEADVTNIDIYDIDSRFNTSVYVHILGSATANTVITFANCEKLRIDDYIEGNPTIVIKDCNLYYDAYIMTYASEISGLKLWYEKFEDTDTDLVLDDMTVRTLNVPIIVEDPDFWTTAVENDNHFAYGLESLTFGEDGTIIGAGLFMKNETTANVSDGTAIFVDEFSLPTSIGLEFTNAMIRKQIQIDGSFISAYATTTPDGYMVSKTMFTAKTGAYDYDENGDLKQTASGLISFMVESQSVTNYEGVTSGTAIDTFDPSEYHIFRGSILT